MILILFFFSTSVYTAALSPSAPGSQAYIVLPRDGDIVPSHFKVVFGLSGMGIAPAGVTVPNTGHHHLLINFDGLPDLNTSMPASDHLVHFGKGQTETDLKLPPGEHTLQLILGDFAHRPHNPPVISDPVTIIVK